MSIPDNNTLNSISVDEWMDLEQGKQPIASTEDLSEIFRLNEGENPNPKNIIAVRQLIQREFKLKVLPSRKKCSEMVRYSANAWKQWERGERKMPKGLWELLEIKTKKLAI